MQCGETPIQDLTPAVPHGVDERARPQPRPAAVGSAASMCSSLCSVSFVHGPVWSQDSQPSAVARLGSNLTAWASASPMVCPPYTSRWPPARQS